MIIRDNSIIDSELICSVLFCSVLLFHYEQNVGKLNSRGAMGMSMCGAVMSAGYTLAADAKALYYMLGLSGRVREQVHCPHFFLYYSTLFFALPLSCFTLLHFIYNCTSLPTTNVCVCDLAMLGLTSSHQITNRHYSSLILVNGTNRLI